MARTILVGVDGSEEAQAAVGVAGRLAGALRLRLVLAHVAHGGDNAEVDAADLLDAAQSSTAPDAHRRVTWGDPATALAQLADREEAALIAVGSRGRGALKSALLGSVSRALVADAERPTLVVGPEALGWNGEKALAPGRSIVCGYDASAGGRRASILAAGLAERLRLRLVLVHVVPPPAATAAAVPAAPLAVPLAVQHGHLEGALSESALSEVAEQLGASRSLEVAFRIGTGPAVARLDEVADEEDAALIAVGAPMKGMLRGGGSLGAELSRTARRPIVVVPN